MSQVVLDTDVVSFIFKSDSRAERFLPHIQHRRQIVSFMTEAELEQWIIQSRWGVPKVARFRMFMMHFAVVPSSRDLVVKWAEVRVAARSVGRRIEYQISKSCPWEIGRAHV